MGCYCEKSTQTAPVVVQLDLFFTYNEKHQVKEEMIMNTVIGPNGKIEIKNPLSKAGDKIVLTALVDCVLGISACSVSECDTNRIIF